jgi:hypothetical protein
LIYITGWNTSKNELTNYVAFCMSYIDNCLAVSTLPWSQLKQPAIIIDLFGIICYPRGRRRAIGCYAIQL